MNAKELSSDAGWLLVRILDALAFDFTVEELDYQLVVAKTNYRVPQHVVDELRAYILEARREAVH